ncbi:MAG: anaerobic sulfatase maturase [Marinifilaceae bacterium]
MSDTTNNTASFLFEQQRSTLKRPYTVMPKCVGPVCNLDCDYCYYLDKEALFPDKPFTVSSYKMDRDTLRTLIRDFIESQPQEVVNFVWHGGEPSLLGVDYFREVLRIQQEFANGKEITNAFQTNGTLITDEWAEFLAANNFLCGLSIDGPKRFHDAHRKFPNGRGTWEVVVRCAEIFKRHGVEFNAMCVVNASNSKHPVAVYNFLKELGAKFMQFSPIVERIAEDDDAQFSLVSNCYDKRTAVMRENVTPQDWGNFLCRIFDTWVRNDVGSYFVNYFDNTLAAYMGQQPALCSMAKYCCCAPAVEHNGDAYCCDHFVFPEYYLGNIHQTPLPEMVKSDKQLFFEEEKERSLAQQCRECKYLAMCGGDCPKNRTLLNAQGEYITELCAGFKQYFAHTEKYFQFMANELRHQRPPSNVMNLF